MLRAICVCIYIYVCVYVFLCIRVYVYMCLCVYVFMCICVYVYMCVYLCLCVLAYLGCAKGPIPDVVDDGLSGGSSAGELPGSNNSSTAVLHSRNERTLSERTKSKRE